MKEQKNNGLSRRKQDPTIAALRRILQSSSEPELEALLSGGLNAEGFPFWALLIFTAKENNSAIDADDHFISLCGCEPAWLERYAAKQWGLVDPFLWHSLHRNHHTVFPYGVTAESAGQRTFLEHFREAGFCFGIAYPVHLAQSRIAMMYAGTKSELTAEELAEKVPFVAALAQQAAVWLEKRREGEARSQIRELSERELEFLELTRKGFTSLDIASLRGISEAQANNTFRRINDKLGTRSRREAALLAQRLGLHTGTSYASNADC